MKKFFLIVLFALLCPSVAEGHGISNVAFGGGNMLLGFVMNILPSAVVGPADAGIIFLAINGVGSGMTNNYGGGDFLSSLAGYLIGKIAANAVHHYQPHVQEFFQGSNL